MADESDGVTLSSSFRSNQLMSIQIKPNTRPAVHVSETETVRSSSSNDDNTYIFDFLILTVLPFAELFLLLQPLLVRTFVILSRDITAFNSIRTCYSRAL